MDELTNRCRAFAEAVVTMVWLVLLAAALNGKSQVTGLDVPEFVLILAAFTIITGICPLLACSFFNDQRVVSDVAALLSAAMLFSLACWIASFTVCWYVVVLPVAVVCLWCTGFRMISYCREKSIHGYPRRTKDFHTINDGSHEFLCCMTGIHFLWLGSLALEGLIIKSHGKQQDLSVATGIVNIIICAIGLYTVHSRMMPPIPSSTMGDIAEPHSNFDTGMIISIATVLGVSMWKSLVLPGLLLIIVGLLIAVFVLMLDDSRPKLTRGSENKELPKLAPLGLTKLMVTGFLTVSISGDSTNRSTTNWFLVFAAAAILSGLTWRIQTQDHVRKVLEYNQSEDSQYRIDETAAVDSSAKKACFCTHTFAAIATVLLMIEIYNVKQSMSEVAPSLAPSCT